MSDPAAAVRDVPFVKMHGLGNDYVYVDERETEALGIRLDPVPWARRLADRHTGVGGDGLIILRRDPEYPCRMEMYNADGSRAEMCGNGIRCVARLAWEKGYAPGPRFAVGTDFGPRAVEVHPDQDPLAVTVAMGPATLGAAPVTLEGRDGATFEGLDVSLGNPHFVIEIDGPVAEAPVLVQGPVLETHAHFPNRANIEFVQVRSRQEVDFRVWERGSGETRACGTGATAAVAALVSRDRVDREAVVHLPGGDLRIRIGEDGETWMTGSAEHVFSGTFSESWVNGD